MRLQTAEFLKFLSSACDHYEKSAPTVRDYCDDLYIRISHSPDAVVLSELLAASALLEDGEWEQPNYAANRFYKLASRLGKDTTGLAGF